MTLLQVLDHLAGDCRLRERGRPGIDVCGAYFTDMRSPRPPDVPTPMQPKLKVVRS